MLQAEQWHRPKQLRRVAKPHAMRLVANHMFSWFHTGASEYETAEPIKGVVYLERSSKEWNGT